MTGTQGTYGPVITRIRAMRYARTRERVITGGYVPCVPAVPGLTRTRAGSSGPAWPLPRFAAHAVSTLASPASARCLPCCVALTAIASSSFATVNNQFVQTSPTDDAWRQYEEQPSDARAVVDAHEEQPKPRRRAYQKRKLVQPRRTRKRQLIPRVVETA